MIFLAMMHSNLLLSLAVVSSTFLTQCLAWQTADDCTGNDLTIVNAAMEEALNMAIYSMNRATDGFGSRLGTSLQNFLGAPNEDDATSLDLVSTWMQNVAATGFATVSTTSGVLIHCSDAYLTKIGDRQYIDTTRGTNHKVDVPPAPPGITPTDNACGGFMQGFAYYGVVVLCNDGPKSAFGQSVNGATLGGFRVTGNLKTNSKIISDGIDVMSNFMSSKILHELMHVASLYQPFGQPIQFPGVLPDKDNGASVGELYGYKAITGFSAIGVTNPPDNAPTANNRQHNADSFSQLAVSWYLPLYAWEYGEVKVVGIQKRPPDRYPGQPNAPGSSNPPTKRRSFHERRIESSKQ